MLLVGGGISQIVSHKYSGLTPRAADTASPCATGGGLRAKAFSPAGLLDKHAVPLTPSLGPGRLCLKPDIHAG